MGLALAFIYLLASGNFHDQPAQATQPTMVSSYASAVQRIAPAVVSIYIQSNQLVPNINPGVSPAAAFRRKNYMGSGVVVSSDGHIVTNKHIIKDAIRIYVSLWNNEIYEAHVIGRDDLTDLAIIKIEAADLDVAKFADSELLNTGDVVFAIGNPFGLNQSVSLGIVSATGRKGLDISPYENFIQTDAAINQGSSGGALVNTQGELVGLGTATYNQPGAEGISFAIPANTIQQIVESIIAHGEVRRGWFGLSFYNPQIYFLYGLKKPDQGVRVSRVYRESAAARAGLKANDIVTHMNGKEVNSFEAYRQRLREFTVGDEVQLQLLRNDQVIEVTLVVESPPQNE